MTLINTKRLANALKLAGNNIDKKAHMPILSHVLVDVAKGRMTISATDLETYLSTRVQLLPTSADLEFQAVVPWKKFHAIVSAAGKGTDEIKIEKTDEKLIVSVGRGEYPLDELPVDDFPRFPTVDNTPFQTGTTAAKFTGAGLLDILTKVLPAVSDDEMRRSLAGVCFDGRNNAIVATDGHRLHYVEVNTDFVGNVDFMVSKQSAKVLSSVLKAKTENVHIRRRDNFLSFVGDDFELVTKKVDSEFPDWTQVVPSQSKHEVTISNPDFNESLVRMNKIGVLDNVRGGGHFIELHFNGQLDIVNLLGGIEKIKTDCFIEPDLKLGMNVKYLLELCRVTKQDFTIGLSTHKNPVKFTTEDLNAVIMPMELDAPRRSPNA